MLKQILKKYENYNWFKELDLSQEVTAYEEIKILKSEFIPKIVLIGEFSAGKSSIINNMLSMDILPKGWQPETKYITQIKYSNENYILVEGEKISLSTKNLKNLKTTSTKIEIYMNNPILKKVNFIDTPGTNDPNTYNDDIVFDIVTNSDLVMFITKANQALSNSEKKFLSKIVKAKDLEKFFFIINFADLVDNRKIVKNEFINNLSLLLSLDKQIIQAQTLLYSVKEKEIYNYVLEHLLDYINKKREKLLNDWEKIEKEKIINQILIKIGFLLDSLEGKVSVYDEELNRINQEIEQFEENIQSDLNKLKSQLENLKQISINNLTNNFENIKKDIANEIAQLDYKQLTTTRYIELRVKKLVEDSVESEWKIFIKNVSRLIEDFNQEIDNSVINSLSLSNAETTKSKKIINLAAIATLGAGAVSALPIMEGALGVGSFLGGVSSIAPILGTIPYIGPALMGIGSVTAVTLPIIGAFALGAGKILFDVAKWGINKTGDLAQAAEEKLYKKKYISNINEQLDKILKQIVSQIQMINFDGFKDKYIEIKFPQKEILEAKIKLLKNKKIEKFQNITQIKKEILQLNYEIEEIKNEL